MSKIIVVIAICFITTAASLEAQYTVEKSTKPAKKDYRIQVENDKHGSPLKVRFMSPDNKTIKTLPADRAIISKNERNLIYKGDSKIDEKNVYEEHDRSLVDKQGKTKWQKKWKNYPKYGVDPEAGFSGWFEGIADNGERSYITYRDMDELYYLVVIDETGKEVAKASNSEMLTDVEISPDGKLVGAKTEMLIDGRAVKHLFFLDVDSGRTKLVKAEDEEWIIGFVLSSSPKPPASNKIRIYWSISKANWAGRKRGERDVFFVDIPKDISTIFQSEGVKK